MAGSTFGKNFQITTWGESHGKGIGVVVDGCPAGLTIDEQTIQAYLNRRKPGQDTRLREKKMMKLRSFPVFLKVKQQELRFR